MEWVLFSILAVIIWSVVNIVDKYVLTKWIEKPVIPTMILGVVGLAASFIVYLTQGFSELSFSNILLAFLAGLLYVLMSLLYYKSVQLEEISRITPLFHFTPIFILILASIFLGEIFTPIKYVGIFLLLIGAILITTKKIKKFSFGKAVWLMLLASLAMAINQIITKYLLGFAGFWTVFSWIRIGAFIFLIPVYFIYWPRFAALTKKHGKKVIAIVSLNESINILGVIFITMAASVGYITLVNALSSIQPVFVFIFTIFLSIFYPKIIKEEINKSTLLLKSTAIILMILGVIIIS